MPRLSEHIYIYAKCPVGKRKNANPFDGCDHYHSKLFSEKQAVTSPSDPTILLQSPENLDLTTNATTDLTYRHADRDADTQEEARVCHLLQTRRRTFRLDTGLGVGRQKTAKDTNAQYRGEATKATMRGGRSLLGLRDG
jgi:hypothetical protein